MHRGGVSVGTELLAQPNPIPERPSAGRVRSLILAGSFIAAAALVMFAAIIEAPLGVRLMLHSVVLALGAAPLPLRILAGAVTYAIASLALGTISIDEIRRSSGGLLGRRRQPTSVVP